MTDKEEEFKREVCDHCHHKTLSCDENFQDCMNIFNLEIKKGDD